MNVKGSICIDMVKMIKSDKSGACDKFLTDKDREIINQKILASIWYPFETYKHCITAIYEVYAKKNPEVAREWGRQVGHTAMTTIYAAYITGRDPMYFLDKYEMIHKKFYDFGKIDVVVEGKTQVLYKMSEFDSECVPLFYIIQGWLERGVELCGAKNVKIEFLTKSWERHPDTTFRISWSL
jgi:uncharacterized protein (TIGR02265 family)